MDKDTTTYETGYLFNPGLKDEEAAVFSEGIRNVITGKGGLILKEGIAKKISLAYPIKKETFAFFNWIEFTLKPENIKEIKKSLDTNELILRFLIIKPQKETTTSKSISGLKIRKKKVAPEAPKPEIQVETKKEEKTPEKSLVKEEELDKKIEELLGE